MGDALTPESFAEIEFEDDFFVEAVEICEPDDILEIGAVDPTKRIVNRRIEPFPSQVDIPRVRDAPASNRGRKQPKHRYEPAHLLRVPQPLQPVRHAETAVTCTPKFCIFRDAPASNRGRKSKQKKQR